MAREKICAGNWKMYKTPQETSAFFEEFKKFQSPRETKFFFPPAYDLPILKDCLNSHFSHSAVSAARVSAEGLTPEFSIGYGPQNIHFEKEGAFTGEISAAAVKTLGATHALIGHSERRTLFGETDEWIAKKMKTAIECGLTPLLCIGETLAEREAHRTNEVLLKQLKAGLSLLSRADANYIVAYEPVWAIGTGKVATPEQAADVHSFIRQVLVEIAEGAKSQQTSILYGGSVKPDNAVGLAAQPNIDGFLVGGASLKPKDFAAIVSAL